MADNNPNQRSLAEIFADLDPSTADTLQQISNDVASGEIQIDTSLDIDLDALLNSNSLLFPTSNIPSTPQSSGFSSAALALESLQNSNQNGKPPLKRMNTAPAPSSTGTSSSDFNIKRQNSTSSAVPTSSSSNSSQPSSSGANNPVFQSNSYIPMATQMMISNHPYLRPPTSMQFLRPNMPNMPGFRPSSATASTGRYDSILSQLTPETKLKMTEYHGQYQSGKITNEEFLAKAKELLGTTQFQMLSTIKPPTPKTTPAIQRTPSASTTAKKRPPDSTGPTQIKRPRPGPPYSALSTPSSFRQSGSQSQFATPFPRPNLPGTPHDTDVTLMDTESLMDVTKYGGVNLKDEEEMIMRDNEALLGQLTSREGGDVYSVEKLFVALRIIKEKMEKAAASSNLKISTEASYYLALSLQYRLRTLLSQMITMSNHRSSKSLYNSFVTQQKLLHPSGLSTSRAKKDLNNILYDIRLQNDPKKQISLIERYDRERQESKQILLDPTETSSTAPSSTTKSKKKQADQPYLTAADHRNMSEEVRKRMTNSTALMAAGGVAKSWMLGGTGTSSTAMTPGPSATTGPGSSAKSKTGTGIKRTMSTPAAIKKSSAMGKNKTTLPGFGAGQKESRITIKDALIVLENDGIVNLGKGKWNAHGVGKNVLRNWAMIKEK
ncbi:transcription initiation factor TFIID component TAF4 family-domain-containing protein [Paraphysoderma sedebokerense]|nr:transcription initiation factor TFIID component TAF4 family-domain-containing protein [Paraphysoderma sedebokerense]